MGTYQPSVSCGGNLPTWKSCAAVLYGMEASTETLKFGNVDDPSTQVVLPAVVSAGRMFH